MFAAALTSILAGGATGLLGMVFQRAFDGIFQYFKAKQDLALFQAKSAHEIAMKDKDAAIMAQEWAARTKVATVEGDAKKDVAATEAFSKSLLTEPERYSSAAALTKNQNWWLVLLDVVRGSVRPLLTAYLCVLTSYIWWEVHSKLTLEDLETAQALEIWLQVVNTILYLTVTVILWWFGTRNQQQYQPGVSNGPSPVPARPASPTRP